jgi:sodium-coupled neutral amino acid transporter 11
MLVIVVAVITQGFRVPSESRGEVKSLLFINSGFFQAVGVISFGKFALPKEPEIVMSNRL